MPTKRTQTSCPNCRQPILVDTQQIFDLREEPQAKELLLSGAVNVAACPNCGFRGPFQVPIVYHDAAKQLLLTHVPQELGLPMHQQEKIIGPLITQVVNSLPQEQRKAYLLQPRTMLTLQTMIETILEADGITKEMMQAQQERLALIQRLLNITDNAALVEVAKQEDKLIDRDFFQIMSALLQNAAAGGQEALAQRMVQVQQLIVPVTTYGQEAQKQTKDVEEAAAALRSLGGRATRADLLDLVLKAKNDLQVQAYVSLARGGMDYEFFQHLSSRIDAAAGGEKQRLAALRQQLLELTAQYDQQMEQRLTQTRAILDALLKETDIQGIIAENPEIVDEFFVRVLESELEAARKSGDLLRSGKLQQIVDVLNELSAAPPEAEVINELIAAPDETGRARILEGLPPEALQNVVDMLMNVMPQVEAGGDPETTAALKAAYKQALRFSMRSKMKKVAQRK
jgi:hypothetical protein